MTAYKRGQVVLLPFPFTNQSGSKRGRGKKLSATRIGCQVGSPVWSNVVTNREIPPTTPNCLPTCDNYRVLYTRCGQRYSPSTEQAHRHTEGPTNTRDGGCDSNSGTRSG